MALGLNEILEFRGMKELLFEDVSAFQRIVDFLQDISEQFARTGCTLKLVPERTVPFIDDSTRVNGYWDEDAKCLVAAVDQPLDQWLPLVAHEFAHYRQWLERREPYTAVMKEVEQGLTVEDLGFGWLEGKHKLSKKKIKLYIGQLRDMELDCERRTLMLIKEYGLPINTVHYAKKAAAYAHFYNVLIETKKWYEPMNEPYNNPVILEYMPSNLDGDFSKISKSLKTIMIKECYGE